MRHENKKDLIRTLSVQTATHQTQAMVKFIKREVSLIDGCKIYEIDKNLYITRGDAATYPCIVAHTDTVHDLYPNFNIFELQGKLFSVDGSTMNRVGIGGDDKVGVFIALEVLKATPVCKVAFFRDEEIGCVGSADADMTFFDNVEFVLQCDRYGNRDFVNEIFYESLYGKEFSDAIQDTLKKYNRKETDGGLTDVYQLVENGLGVCSANMSCGYYDPHSNNEYVILNHVFATLSFVMSLFDVLSGTVWEMSDIDRTNSYKSNKKHAFKYYGYGRRGYDTFDDYYDDDNFNTYGTATWENDLPEKDGTEPCPNCLGTEIMEDEIDGRDWCFNCQEYTDVLQRLVDETNEDLPF